MKNNFKLSVVTFGLLGAFSVTAYANNNEKLILALQQQVTNLQQQIDSLGHKKYSYHNLSEKKKTGLMHAKNKKTEKQKGQEVILTPAEIEAEKADENAPKAGIYGPNNLPQVGTAYLPIDFDVPGQSFVSTGPYLGVPLSYSGSNLIVNTPGINEDVSLLKLRQNINTRLAKLGIERPEDHSHLLLSGNLEGQVFFKSKGKGSNSSDIDVTNFEFDGYILGPSSWTSGLFALNYENDPGSLSGSISSNHRTFNSRVFVSKAFITLGDLTKLPVYASIGQMYVPFGVYSSNMIASPMTKTIFRTKARAGLVGFDANTFYGSVYAFKGDSHAASSTNINNGGANGGYRFKVGEFKGDIGGGVIGNIADSVGMQVTENTPSWGGFGSTSTICGPMGTSACGNESLTHAVTGYDIHASASWGKWDFLAEYLTAVNRFGIADMTFNSLGARPQALNTELAYTFIMFGDKPTSLAVGYGMTKQALALGMPMTRYSLVANTSWWRNTLQSIEFRHDRNYSTSSMATGSGVSASPGTGACDNTVTAQIDIYF